MVNKRLATNADVSANAHGYTNLIKRILMLFVKVVSENIMETKHLLLKSKCFISIMLSKVKSFSILIIKNIPLEGNNGLMELYVLYVSLSLYDIVTTSVYLTLKL